VCSAHYKLAFRPTLTITRRPFNHNLDNRKIYSNYNTRSPAVAEIADRTVWDSHGQLAEHGYSWRGNFSGSGIQYVLIYSPDGTNVYGSRTTDCAGSGSVKGVESCKIVFLGWHFLFSCSDTFALGCVV